MSSALQMDTATLNFETHACDAIASFGGFGYYLDHPAADVISFQPSRPANDFFSRHKGDVSPCTVINWSKAQFNQDDLNTVTSKLALQDDVWTPAFLEGTTMPWVCTRALLTIR